MRGTVLSPMKHGMNRGSFVEGEGEGEGEANGWCLKNSLTPRHQQIEIDVAARFSDACMSFTPSGCSGTSGGRSRLESHESGSNVARRHSHFLHSIWSSCSGNLNIEQ